MSKTTRRSMMGAFAAAAGVVLLASIAWACAPIGGHSNANPWFCRNGVQRCTYNARVGTLSPKANTTGSYYSMLGGAPLATDVVSANTSYTLRWITGDHSSLTDIGCIQTTHSAAFKKTNGADASFTTGTTGSWNAQGPVSMPAAGTYTICAVPTTNTAAGMTNHHYPFYVM